MWERPFAESSTLQKIDHAFPWAEKIMPESLYLHANALVLREKGLLLRGASGAGKSALTLALLFRVEARGDFARLVADDRVGIEARGGRLIARPHPEIAGVIEARGLGLLRAPFEAACVLHAVVDILGPDQPPTRLPEDGEKRATLRGIALPRLAIAPARCDSIDKIILFLEGNTTI
jgi:HPr kinase/phosphorylase